MVILLVTAQAAYTVLESARVQELQRRQRELVEPRSRAAQALETAVLNTAVRARNYALSGAAGDLETFQRAVDEMVGTFAALQELPSEADAQARLGTIAARLPEFRRRVEQFVRLTGTPDVPGGHAAAEQAATAAREALLRALGEYIDLQRGVMARTSDATAAASTRLMTTIATVAAIVLLSAVIASVLVGRSVRRPAQRIAAAAAAMAAGDYEPALSLGEHRLAGAGTTGRFRDELREAAHVFGRMAATLRSREERMAAQERLSAALASNVGPVELATDALRALTTYVGAEVGAIYVVDADADDADELRPLATLAVQRPLAPIRIGQGVAGQAVADQRTHVVREIPDDTVFLVDLGLQSAPPRCVAAVPLNVGKMVLGVLVVAGLHDLSADAVSFLEESASQVAVTIENAVAHVRIEALAATLQQQNQRLQAQNEELQAQGEELQAQAEELHAQTEELHAQTEKLQAQGEELQTQTEALRAHGDQLETRNEQLAEAEAHKDRFLAVLGHELRNPLAAITAAAEVLRTSPGGDAAATGRDVIARQSRQLARLLDDLLDTIRMKSGKIVLLRRPIDLAEAVSQAITASTADTQHTIRVHAQQAWTDADPARVEQIVTNLLGNALKYTPAGGTITIVVAQEGDTAVLRVIDTGMGVPPAILPRIFEPFVQAGPAGAPGLGLGLTLVRQLVELHGGTVEASSPGRDRGTTITVRLPLCPPPAVIAARAAPTPGAPENCSVLLVEDNEDARLMLRTFLDHRGHTVHEAADGPTGVSAALAHRPDVVLVDLDLPGFDGYEVARRLRAEAGGRELRLIALSGYGGQDVRRRALAAGFDDHVIKPIDPERLAALLRDTPAR